MTDINSLLFKIEMSPQIPSQGAILISEPFLREEYFCHAVISIVDYSSKNSAMGIVINKPTHLFLDEIVPDIYSDTNIRIYCGGPLSSDRLYYIHTLGDLITDAKKISEGLYIGGDFNKIIEYVNSGNEIEGKIKFFLGYCGWEVGQLEEELSQHVWAVTSPLSNESILIGSGDKTWHHYVKSMGKEYRGWLYHPENPQMN